MEAYRRVLKSEGHMSPLRVAITHLNDLFMQNNLVAMVTVKHVSMCAEIFPDIWDWEKSPTAPHGTAAVNANVRIFILWSSGAVATFYDLLSRGSGRRLLFVPLFQFIVWVFARACLRCAEAVCDTLLHRSCALLLNRTGFDSGTELCGDAFITFNLQGHNKVWDKLVLTIWHFPELFDTNRCGYKFLTVWT